MFELNSETRPPTFGSTLALDARQVRQRQPGRCRLRHQRLRNSTAAAATYICRAGRLRRSLSLHRLGGRSFTIGVSAKSGDRPRNPPAISAAATANKSRPCGVSRGHGTAVERCTRSTINDQKEPGPGFAWLKPCFSCSASPVGARTRCRSACTKCPTEGRFWRMQSDTGRNLEGICTLLQSSCSQQGPDSQGRL